MINSDGEFEGYASLFFIPDQTGDIVMPGAFKQSLSRRGTQSIRLLFQHDPKEPVGLFSSVVEDEKGLRVKGRLIPTLSRASDLIQLIQAGAIDGLSIGFRTQRASKDVKNRQRRLWQVDLWEISIVTFPMMERARIHPHPSAIAHAHDGKSKRHRELDRKFARAASLFRKP